MNHNTKLFLLIYSLFSNLCLAQININSFQSDNFYEYADNCESFWKDKPHQKGNGFKSFKRWEWFMKDRVKLNGSFYNTEHVWNESQRFEAFKSNALSSRSINNWKSLGPYSSNGGFEGVGRINCIAFHPSNDKILYVGTAGGGIYKSIDEGSTWTNTTANLPSLSVSDIVVHPTNPDIIYIATGDADGHGNYYGGFSFGVLKSTDGGKNWNKTGLAYNYISSEFIFRLVINPLNPSILYAATTEGLYETKNNGTTWNKLLTGRFCDIELHPTNPSIIYGITLDTGKLYKSTNGGNSFSLLLQRFNAYRSNIAVSKARPNAIWVLACSKTDYGFEYITYAEDGSNFVDLIDRIKGDFLSSSLVGNRNKLAQGYYDLAFSVNPTNANEFLIGGVNTWQSKNGGQTMKIANYWHINQLVPVVHADKHNIYYHPINNKIYEANDGGIYVSSDNGITWRDLTKGIDIGQVYRMDYFSGNLTAGHQDNGTKRMKGSNWETIMGGDGMDNAISRNNNNIQYASIQFGIIYRTNNNWQNFDSLIGPSSLGQVGNWVSPYVVHPVSGNIYVGYNDVFCSKDNGTSWKKIKSGGTDPLDQMAISPIDERKIYVSLKGKLYATIDGGATWNIIFDNPNLNITSIRCHPENKEIVAITLGGFEGGKKVYSSKDGGLSWENISYDLLNVPVNSIEIQKGANGAIFIGNDFGVFTLKKGQDKWEVFSNSLPTVPITDMVIDHSESKLYASTYGRGMWVSEIENVENDTSSFALQLHSPVTIIPKPIEYQKSFKVLASILNVGSTTFKGEFTAALFDTELNFVEHIDIIPEIDGLMPNYYYINGGLNFTSSGSKALPGHYFIGIFAKSASSDWVLVSDKVYKNLIPVEIVQTDKSKLVMHNEILTSTQEIKSQVPFTVGFDVVNVATTTFNGYVGLHLYNENGGWIEQVRGTSQVSLLPNYHFMNGLTFENVVINVNPGVYYLVVREYDLNKSAYSFVQNSSSFLNYKRIVIGNVDNSAPDRFEVNNEVNKAYPLPLNISEQITIITTQGSNIHNPSDIDYYRIVLPQGSKYKITGTLYDKNQYPDNNNTYTLDGVWSYRKNNSWSPIFDNLSQEFTAESEETIIFKVNPILQGLRGTYLLEIEIEKIPVEPPYFTLDKKDLFSTANPFTQTINIQTNCDWDLRNIPSWISVSKTSGTSSSTINISCTQNNSIITRVATIEVHACNGLIEIITITQYGCSSPSIPAITVTKTSICQGESATMTINNPCADCQYIWSNNLTGTSITVNQSGKYKVTATNFCTSVQSSELEITTKMLPPKPIISLSGTIKLCDGLSKTISVNNVCNECTIKWSTGETTSAINVNASGTYNVVFVNDCGESQKSENIFVEKETYVPTIFVNNLCYLAGPSGNTSYQWQLNGLDISSATTQFYVANLDGYYTLRSVRPDNCSGISEPKFISGCTSSIDDNDEQNIFIYPNPFTNELIIDLKGKNDGKIKSHLNDINGKCIKLGYNIDNTIRFDTQDLPSGTYIIQLWINHRIKQYRVVKM